MDWQNSHLISGWWLGLINMVINGLKVNYKCELTKVLIKDQNQFSIGRVYIYYFYDFLNQIQQKI